MAGADPSGAFDAADFRTQIRAAMVMGLPPVEAERPTFGWKAARTYARAAADGGPWSPNQAPAAVAAPKAAVQVPCAISAFGASQRAGRTTESVGAINADRLVLTFLDEDYAQIEGFDFMTYNRTVYHYDHQQAGAGGGGPNVGLFDVGVISVVVVAEDAR